MHRRVWPDTPHQSQHHHHYYYYYYCKTPPHPSICDAKILPTTTSKHTIPQSERERKEHAAEKGF
jgi:hypothetical protein